jgi:hypothetical protein
MNAQNTLLKALLSVILLHAVSGFSLVAQASSRRCCCCPVVLSKLGGYTAELCFDGAFVAVGRFTQSSDPQLPHPDSVGARQWLLRRTMHTAGTLQQQQQQLPS